MGPATFGRLRHVVRLGLLGGVVVVLVGLLGLLMTFAGRDIVSGKVLWPAPVVGDATQNGKTAVAFRLSLSWVLVFMIVYVTAARSIAACAARRAAAVLVGLATATVSGAVVIGFAALAAPLGLRQMFINASPELFKLLGGAGPMVVAGGLAAGLMHELPEGWRRPITLGALATVLVGLLSDQIALVMGNHNLDPARFRAILAAKGLAPMGALIIFALASGLRYIYDARGALWRARLDALPPARRSRLRLAGYAAAILLLLGLPRFLGSYHSEVLNQVGLFVLMGLGLNIVVGFAGMLDLGYVAFFALGAYTVAILTSPESFLATGGHAPTSFWGALPAAILIAVLAGVLLGIPVLRLRGDYLAIVTLGFGEIIRLLALSEWLKPYLGGAQGIAAIRPIAIGSWIVEGPDKPQRLFYIILGACLLAAFVATRIKDSSLGRAWMAIREDEDVAEAMGIHLVRTKLMAFAIGAAFSGLAGTIFGPKLGSIYPHSFSLLISINILSLIIVGGMGSIAGVIVGALALVGLPELLREFAEYRLLVYGAVLVAMMLLRPEGLLPATITKRMVRARDDAAVAELPS